MSDIYGEGWGSSHDWQNKGTNQVGSAYWVKATYYVCKKCGITFKHEYDLIPDIFKAIELNGIPDKCSKKEAHE